MIRTLLVPGIDGSPAPHWQHWWEAVDPSARSVTQSSWEAPCPADWPSRIARAVERHPGAVLVAHSLGAVAVAMLLTERPGLDIAGALLVAPAEPSRCPRIAAFGPIPEGRLGARVIVAASRTDPWMGQAQARLLASRWGAAFVDLGNAGHVNVASGHGPWPEGRALRARLGDTPLHPVQLGSHLTAPELRP